MRVPREWAQSAAILMTVCASVRGQAPTGGIMGTVTTAWETVVPGANVTLTNRQTGSTQSSTSSQNGEYAVAGAAPGSYDVSVTATDFKPFARYNIQLAATPLRMNLRLRPAKEDGADSIKQLESAAAFKPGDFAAQFRLARAYLNAGSLEKARDQLEKSLALQPKSVPVEYVMAQLALRKGDAAGAWQHAQEILKLQPDNAAAIVLQSTAYVRMGRIDVASELLQGILKSNPNDADAWAELGILNLNLQQYADADDQFHHAYALDPASMLSLSGSAQIQILQNEPDKAIQVFAVELQKKENEPRRRELQREIANLEFRLKRYDKAIADYQATVDLYKDGPTDEGEIHYRIGMAYRATNNIDSAIENLKKATELAPNDVTYWNALGDAYDGADRKAEAIVTYRTGLRMDPKNALTMNNLAYLIVDSGGDPDEALALAQKAREQMPDSNEVRDTIGWIYFKKDLSESAARAFADLVEKHPENWMFHYHYAMALAKNGDRDGARKQFDLALENHPRKTDEARIKAEIGKLH